MTANAMQGDREKALEAGMDDYVPKPVKPEELEAVLVRWVTQDAQREGAESDTTLAALEVDSNSSTAPDSSLDRSVLAGLRELQEEGDPNIIAELGEIFLEDVPPQLEALRDAIKGGDASSVERVAHALKGSCASMGALRIVAICAELQDMGQSGELERAPVLGECLEAEFGRVRKALEAEIARSER